MSLPLTTADSSSENTPNSMDDSDQPPSSGKMVYIFLAFLGLTCFIHTVVIVVAGLGLGSTEYVGPLFAFWGCMTGSSCVVTLLGSCSARKSRTYISFWRIGTLALFLGHIAGGIALGGKALLPDEFSMNE